MQRNFCFSGFEHCWKKLAHLVVCASLLRIDTENAEECVFVSRSVAEYYFLRPLSSYSLSGLGLSQESNWSALHAEINLVRLWNMFQKIYNLPDNSHQIYRLAKGRAKCCCLARLVPGKYCEDKRFIRCINTSSSSLLQFFKIICHVICLICLIYLIG